MRTTRVLFAAAVALSAAACSTTPQESGPSPSSGQNAVSGAVTVYAAASLRETFEKIGADFHTAYPATEVKFSFGGSSGLLNQLTQGAPADVFATADTPTMDKARTAGLITDTTPFATNTLTIATAPGNPKAIAGLRDLTRPGTSVVVCATPVPCGNATATITRKAGVTLTPVSEEDSVSSVLSKVRLGQADAGLVYRTDVRGADGAVASVDFPEASDAVNVYPIGSLKAAKNPAAARAFVDFVVGERGRSALSDAGFGAP